MCSIYLCQVEVSVREQIFVMNGDKSDHVVELPTVKERVN